MSRLHGKLERAKSTHSSQTAANQIAVHLSKSNETSWPCDNCGKIVNYHRLHTTSRLDWVDDCQTNWNWMRARALVVSLTVSTSSTLHFLHIVRRSIGQTHFGRARNWKLQPIQLTSRAKQQAKHEHNPLHRISVGEAKVSIFIFTLC